MPRHRNRDLAFVLGKVDLGASVAEQDEMLETTRIETSAFTDLYFDRIDLVVGTKGSGKSAIYKLFVNSLADLLLDENRVVVAHGTHASNEPVFHAFKDHFSYLTESDFCSFWCIYLISLARDHFIRDPRFKSSLRNAKDESRAFEQACTLAGIPESPKKASLKEILKWSLAVLFSTRPKLESSNDGSVSLTFVTDPELLKRIAKRKTTDSDIPSNTSEILERLQSLLSVADLNLWLMIDRLDEIFERRSTVETNALRGLLRASSIFRSNNVRVKLFLRDDMLEELSKGPHGFPALTHVTARMSNRLEWSEEQILKLIVRRLFLSSPELCNHLDVRPKRFEVGTSYCTEAFYRVFPEKINRGSSQSTTLRWIYKHVMDGRGVVTPRDVIDLLTKAKQWQQDQHMQSPGGESDVVISAAAIKYGFEELSKRKRDTYLQAEFPHFWKDIQKLINGKTDYSIEAVRAIFGNRSLTVTEHFVGLGLFKEFHRNGVKSYQIPYIYRPCLNLTQGRADADLPFYDYD